MKFDALKNAELKSFVRIKEVERLDPISDTFDTEHLKLMHAYIFQDSPQHKPGEFREDRPTWVKNRRLESEDLAYVVPYLRGKRIAECLRQTLDGLKKRDEVESMSPSDFSEYIGGLYGDLDFIHPFVEGNSRTLRTFTKLLAKECGHRLDWNTAGANAVYRDVLYKARDVEVMKRAYPGLSKQQVDALPQNAQSRDKFEAYYYGLARIENSESLASVIGRAVYGGPTKKPRPK